MKTESLDMGSIEMQPGFGMEKCSHQCQPSKLTSRKVQAVDFNQCSTYRKDTLPFISCFHVLTYSFFTVLNRMNRLKHQIGIIFGRSSKKISEKNCNQN